MKSGIISKGVGGFYDVLIDGEILRCTARGIFRKDNITPVVGDRVLVSEDDMAIAEILPRKNRLIRPAIANIDLLGIVASPTHPEPDLYLVDKLMLEGENNDIDILLIINKTDLGDDETLGALVSTYEPTGYPIVKVSCLEERGFDRLNEEIEGKIVTLAGQSGVGKSSIINMLYPQKELETGELSQKIGRGRHTTRHTKLLPLPSGAMLVDTPGFSTMTMGDMEPEELQYLYPDFSEYIHECRFNGCLHHREPDCTVKEAVGQGYISKGRYDRYIRILEELIENRRNQW